MTACCRLFFECCCVVLSCCRVVVAKVVGCSRNGREDGWLEGKAIYQVLGQSIIKFTVN
jgi:hypothetical protein